MAATPVAHDQTMAAIDDQWTQVNATVPDTVQLRMWLRSMGADAVVEAPLSLKEQLTEESLELIRLYSGASLPEPNRPAGKIRANSATQPRFLVFGIAATLFSLVKVRGPDTLGTV